MYRMLNTIQVNRKYMVTVGELSRDPPSRICHYLCSQKMLAENSGLHVTCDS